MRTVIRAIFLALTAGLLSLGAPDDPGESSYDGLAGPELLADTVLARFARRDLASFQRVYPFEQGRSLLRSAMEDSVQAVAVFGRVLRRGERSALLMLAGYLRYGNSGDETSTARDFSGLYLATEDTSRQWWLRDQLRLEDQARIHSHRLVVDLLPGHGLVVVDSLLVTVLGTAGLPLRLNHTAELSQVLLDSRPARYQFGGGVLWVDAPRGVRRLVIRHSIDVAKDSVGDPNSGRFAPKYGHVRNQYFWHSFLWFDDAAQARITVTAPAPIQVATDLEQIQSVQGDRRIIEAATQRPVAALSLFYDADWSPVHLQAEAYRFTVFATPDFKPTPDTLARAFERVVRLLSSRFGTPGGSYRAVVQQRARPAGSAGWPFMSNAVIAANQNGGPLIVQAPRPRAYFGHEIAHAWTHPTGPGRNFLSEGWATFAEGLILHDVFGPNVEDRFWEAQRENYLRGNFEGRARLTDDPSNNGVSYSKGAWVLRMLEDEIGRPAFDSGMRSYVSSSHDSSAGLPQFLEQMSRASGRDVTTFLTPWLEGAHIPRVEATIDESRLVLRQTQPDAVFNLRLPIAIVSGPDTIRVTVPIIDRQVSVTLPRQPGRGASVVVDPGRRFLIAR